MSGDRFVEWVSEAIVSLPQDMKAILRIVDDPDIDDESRILAAGALMHVLSASNAIPGARGVLAYVDDVLVLRLALERIEKKCPEPMERHREESPELLESLHDDLASARDYLGDLITVLEKACNDVPKLKYEGHTPERCVRDTEASNWLYDAVHEAIVEQLEFDEDEVMREAKQIGLDPGPSPLPRHGEPSVRRAVVLAALVAFAVSGCSVDTALGLVGQVQDASVSVTGSDTATVVAVDMTMDVRLGTHAMGSRDFIVPKVDLLVGGNVVATVNLDRPAGFNGTLAPGDHETLMLHGATVPGAFPMAHDPLCASGASAEVLVHFEDTTQMTAGQASFSTASITCS